MESEFIALALAGKEAEWLRNMFYDRVMATTDASHIYLL
jgi:hypothetical protein